MSDQRYPLDWPSGWKRTAPAARKWGRFSKQDREYIEGSSSYYRRNKPISVYEATKRVLYELGRLGVRDGDSIISTNVPVRLDGLPRGGAKEPEDPGVAVYWTLKGKSECMAIDGYTSVADNLAAIAASLAALRTVERHGGAEILDRAFRGFAALPERASGRSWRQVFGVGMNDHLNADAVRTRFNALAHKHHPDKGGSEEAFQELMWAREQALAEVGQ